MGKPKSGTSGQERLQREAFNLQKEALQFQKDQALKLERAKEGKDIEVAGEKQRLIELARKGRASTIKTIQKRPSFEVFRAKFAKDNALDIPETALVNKKQIQADIDTEAKGFKTEFDKAIAGLGAIAGRSKTVLNTRTGKISKITPNGETGEFRIGSNEVEATLESFSRFRAGQGKSLKQRVSEAEANLEARTTKAKATQLAAAKKKFAKTDPFVRRIQRKLVRFQTPTGIKTRVL